MRLKGEKSEVKGDIECLAPFCSVSVLNCNHEAERLTSFFEKYLLWFLVMTDFAYISSAILMLF